MNNETNNQNNIGVQPQVTPTNSVPSVPVQPTQQTVVPAAPAPQQTTPTTPVQPTTVVPIAPEAPVAPAAPAPQQTTPTAPTQPSPVVPTVPEVSIPETPVVEDIKVEEPVNDIKPISNSGEDISDVANTTFDYDALYGNSADIQSDVVDKNDVQESTDKTVFKERDLDIQNRSLTNRTASDITPGFNINVLDKNTTEEDSRDTDNVLNDKQQDKADTRRKIVFILMIVLILIIFVKFIFPILSGYKF